MTEKTSDDFLISNNAAKRINILINQEINTGSRFRIEVLGGGCSGFQYKFDFDNNQNQDDITFNKNGVEVIIDKTSIDFLKGSELDYVETLGSAAFVVKNPNATAKCGCGNSFSV